MHEATPIGHGVEMLVFGQPFAFWFATGFAVTVKWLLTKYRDRKTEIASVAFALFAPWAFVPAVLDFWDLDPKYYLITTTVAIALFADQGMKFAMGLTIDRVIEIYKLVRK